MARRILFLLMQLALLLAVSWRNLDAEEERRSSGAMRFAVIGDFGMDNFKPKSATTGTTTTPSKANPTAKNSSIPQDDDDDDRLLKTMEVPPPSREQRNPYQAAVAKLVASWKPDFIISTGDNNYPRGEAATIDENIGKYYAPFIGNYKGNYGPGSATNRFFPVLGNHDWDAPRVKCQAYLDYFSLPGNERYYDFTQGPLHFFMLDSDSREIDGVTVKSRQHTWFAKRVAESQSPFQIVVCHHPPYSSGWHGDNKFFQWNFETHGVDLVLSGHDHNYERIERNGLTHIINGSGGANLRQFKTVLAEGSAARYQKLHGAMRMDLVRKDATWELTSRFIDVDGKEIDTFRIVRSAAATK